MCKLNIPDCFNCPYEDCNATEADITRQWRYTSTGISYTEDVRLRQAKYNRTEKGKARLKRYYESSKGQEANRRKSRRSVASGKNAEYCRRYRERKKAEKNNTENV